MCGVKMNDEDAKQREVGCPRILFPFTYHPEEGKKVYEASKHYICESGKEKEITDYSWAYYRIGDLIPHSAESFWSGHFFPWEESWEELQISCSLCLFGYYKQAMVSLRSSLEVGLLSVYWNLNDDGHQIIQRWLHSKEDTPRFEAIWKMMVKHKNFALLQENYDFKARLLNLKHLHNYVHTKGRKYSNHFGIKLGNLQTFEVRAFEIWFSNFVEVLQILAICHLTKYPLGTMPLPIFHKFGFNAPMFGGLEEDQVKSIERLVGEDVFKIINKIGHTDPSAIECVEWVHNLPDMTREALDNQIIELDKMEIQGSGLENWLNNQEVIKSALDEQGRQKLDERIEILKKWAKENGFEQPPLPGNRA
jgi:hypothetical protein